MNHSKTRLFQKSAGGLNLRNQKIFQPILRRPATKKVNADTREIMTRETPEQSMKKILDQSYAQTKKAHISSALASASHSSPPIPLNPIISSGPSETFGQPSNHSTKTKRKSVVKKEKPRKKQKKSLKSSIFDNYM